MFIIPFKKPKASVLVYYVFHVRMLKDTKKLTATSLTHYIILFWTLVQFKISLLKKKSRGSNRSDRDKRKMQVFKIHS